MSEENNPPRIAAVVVAAGSGTRFGAPKQFAMLGGKPLLTHALATFDAMDEFAERVLVLPADTLDHSSLQWIRSRLNHPIKIVAGGANRADSVLAGLDAIDDCELVAVHDGARPFVPVAAMRTCVELLKARPKLAAAIVASPVTDTLKATSGDGVLINSTIDRNNTIRAETPQVCRTALLREALRSANTAVTDEAQALEAAGHSTAYVLHELLNIKVTRLFDIEIAEAWLRNNTIDEGSRACYRGEIHEQ